MYAHTHVNPPSATLKTHIGNIGLAFKSDREMGQDPFVKAVYFEYPIIEKHTYKQWKLKKI